MKFEGEITKVFLIVPAIGMEIVAVHTTVSPEIGEGGAIEFMTYVPRYEGLDWIQKVFGIGVDSPLLTVERRPGRDLDAGPNQVGG